jgi:uncharacterized protein (UPF0276 family)
MDVGLMYNGALQSLITGGGAPVDFLAIIPERCWIDHGRRAARRFETLPDEVATLERLRAEHPIVAHGIGLSIASASTFDVEHLGRLAEWHRRYHFAWISEHLSAVRVRTDVSVDHHAGLALPLPWDGAVLDVVAERVAHAQDVLGCRLLLENGVVHTPVPECEMTEVEFLNALTARTGCGLLLDLHNLYVNAVNLGVDADAFVDGLDLRAVGEIHVAGGNELYGVYLDSHAGGSPAEVRRLLARTAPRCPDLRGVTFEYHESYFQRLGGDAGVVDELAVIRDVIRSVPPERERPCRWPSFNAPSPI